MKARVAYAAAVLGLLATGHAQAGLHGSLYDFSVSQTGSTTILANPGTYTDPTNAFFCVGPNADGCMTSGMSGSFAFTDLSPTMSRITFGLSGSTFPADGSFTLNLGNIVTPDGFRIGGVSLDAASSNLVAGSLNVASFDATDIVFTGTPSGSYSNVFGPVITFDVTDAPAAVPEPATLTMLGLGLAALGLLRRRPA